MQRLSDDEQLHIMQYLSHLQCLELACVSKRFARLVDAPARWATAHELPRTVFYTDFPYELPAPEVMASHERALMSIQTSNVSTPDAVITDDPTHRISAANRAAVIKWYMLYSVRELSRRALQTGWPVKPEIILARARSAAAAAADAAAGGGDGAGGGGGGDGGGGGGAAVAMDHVTISKFQTATFTFRIMLALALLFCIVVFAIGLIVRLDFANPATATYNTMKAGRSSTTVTVSSQRVLALSLILIPVVMGAAVWFLGVHFWTHMIMQDERTVLYGAGIERLSTRARFRRVLSWAWIVSTLQLGPFISAFWLLMEVRNETSAQVFSGGGTGSGSSSITTGWSYVSIANPLVMTLIGHGLLFLTLTPSAPWNSSPPVTGAAAVPPHSSAGHRTPSVTATAPQPSFLATAHELIIRNGLMVSDAQFSVEPSLRCLLWCGSMMLLAWFVRSVASAIDEFLLFRTAPTSISGGGGGGGAVPWIGVFTPLIVLLLIHFMIALFGARHRRSDLLPVIAASIWTYLIISQLKYHAWSALYLLILAGIGMTAPLLFVYAVLSDLPVRQPPNDHPHAN